VAVTTVPVTIAATPTIEVAITRLLRCCGTFLKNEVGASIPLRLYNINAQAIRTIDTKK
jgi:hypothetical protein